MRAVGLKILKNRLSEYVRLAAGGETVLVTDRDRVVAELIAPRAGHGEFASNAFLAEAVRSGHLRPPLLRSDEPPPSGAPATNSETLMRELASDREDR